MVSTRPKNTKLNKIPHGTKIDLTSPQSQPSKKMAGGKSSKAAAAASVPAKEKTPPPPPPTEKETTPSPAKQSPTREASPAPINTILVDQLTAEIEAPKLSDLDTTPKPSEESNPASHSAEPSEDVVKKRKFTAEEKGKFKKPREASPAATMESSSDEKADDMSTAGDEEGEKDGEEETEVKEESEHSVPVTPSEKFKTPATTTRVTRGKGKQSVPPPSNIQKRAVVVPKTVCFETLKDLNILDQVKGYFAAIGWEDFLTWPGQVSEKLVKEFYEELEVRTSKDGGPLGISFKLMGSYNEASIFEINMAMGAASFKDKFSKEYQDRLTTPPERTQKERNEIWRALSKEKVFKSQEAKNHQLKDNALRICHRILAYNFYGKKDNSNTISLTELDLLWCMTKKIKVNFGAFLCAQLKNILSKPAQRLSLAHFPGIYAQRMELKLDFELMEMMPEEKFDHACLNRMADIRVVGEDWVFTNPEEVKALATAAKAKVKTEPVSRPSERVELQKEEILEQLDVLEEKQDRIGERQDELHAALMAYFVHVGFRYPPEPKT